MKWLKELVKQDIIAFLFVCFLIGVTLIWSADQWSNIHLSNDGELNASVSWLTALAIFWYAYETYQLKKSTSDQVDIQEEIMLNEFLPILEPLAIKKSAVLQNGKLQNLYVRNLGKGPAKYVQICVGSVKVSANFSVAAGEDEVVDMDDAAKQQLATLTRAKPKTLTMKIIYEDIYARKFTTENIRLDRHAKSEVYTLHHGAWDFVRAEDIKARQSQKLD